MKTNLAVLGASLMLSANVSFATTVALFDSGDSNTGWSYSNNGAGYKTQSTATRDPGFGTGNYLTPASTSYDDQIARALQSTAQLVAGGKVTFSFDYFTNDSDSYNMRFGIYSGSAMVKSSFPAWGGADSINSTTADWKGYLGSLTIGGTAKTDVLTTAQNTSSSNFLWGTWGSGLGKTTTYASSPVRNDGQARTAVMELILGANNALTINLYEGIAGSVSGTPNVTTTITDPTYILTNFNYVGLVMRSNGSAGSNTDYIAIDNIRVTVDTPVPEAASLGFMVLGGAGMLMRQRRR